MFLHHLKKIQNTFGYEFHVCDFFIYILLCTCNEKILSINVELISSLFKTLLNNVVTLENSSSKKAIFLFISKLTKNTNPVQMEVTIDAQ
jgi:hypothetical protein